MVPDDPLEFIRRCTRQRKIRWTYHVNIRIRGRFIPREAVIESTSNFEIIEEYPDDKYLPSYLVFSSHRGIIFHMVIAVDVEGDNVRIVTVYHPDNEEWKPDLKTRRSIK